MHIEHSPLHDEKYVSLSLTLSYGVFKGFNVTEFGWRLCTRIERDSRVAMVHMFNVDPLSTRIKGIYMS